MDFVGEFHLEEKDGKLFLVYHHSKYHLLPQIQNTSRFGEKTIDNHLLQPYFLCPIARWRVARLHAGRLYKAPLRRNSIPYALFPLISSPEYLFFKRYYTNHPVLPLYWCNNKEFEQHGGCCVCAGINFGMDYYFCHYCDKKYHRECVESPLQIKHPYHPEHPLQLYFYSSNTDIIECLCCERQLAGLVYYCGICKIFMHPICVMKPIPFVVDQPKRHDHPLTFFHRKCFLICNVCGLLRKLYSTYICVRCNFVAHIDCMNSPRIIKISRHVHRISYISSLRSGEWSCGICRQNIDGDYGAYTCEKCCDYVVHTICALEKDVWDGEDLEGVSEEVDITLDVEPFDMISEGVILHFLHDHHLSLQVNILYEDIRLCQACVLPIFEGNSYSCIECNFALHETCAKSHRKLQHALHSHPLTLRIVRRYEPGCYRCNACDRFCGGFIYGCPLKECNFGLDIRCASISEPLDFQGHEHPLYLALTREEKHICHVCKTKCNIQLNCTKCNFIICIKCTTLPSKVRYEHDKHFLRVLCRGEVCAKSWCEVCEHELRDTNTNVIYGCDECCTTVHVECLFGDDPYLKPGQLFQIGENKFQILCKSKTSRPLCNFCINSCQNKIFIRLRDNIIACSMRCVINSL